MKITIIYDNEVYKKGLKADWGFSCLIDMEGTTKILFDTGANGSILLSNMEALGIQPRTIDEIFISHPHWDHTGGLHDFLKKNDVAKIYVPASLPKPRGAREAVSVDGSLQIHENVFSTGELQGIEQSLVVRTVRGLVVVVGCSHPGVRSILNAASQFGRVYALIGGLHGFREFDLLRDLNLICPCHCTQFMSEIRSLYPNKCVGGGAGKVIEV
jgi:7,8-dihydropterin-6-yl-methyl-4-(beta-D-ribofuranosyl)aminobenzene 5'-phosphate synthase